MENSQQREMCYAANRPGTRDNKKWDAELSRCLLSIFCRDEGFDHVSRYVTGLIISPNKTLQGIYDLQVWDGKKPSRRSMHSSVFESGWGSDALIQRASVVGSESERFEFARGKTTFGQRCRTIAREVFRSMLELTKRLFTEGKSCDEVLDMLMPA